MSYFLTAFISGGLGLAAWLLADIVGRPILDLKDKIKQALTARSFDFFRTGDFI